MIDRGAVWWGPAPHKSGPAYRPWLVVSDDSHPFADEESIVLGLTTTNHSRAIVIPDEAWIEGGSDKDAYVSPWYVTTIKHRDLDDWQGHLDDSLVDRAVDVLHDVTR